MKRSILKILINFVNYKIGGIVMYSPYSVDVRKCRRKYRSMLKAESVDVVNEQTGELSSCTRFVGQMRLYDTTDFVKLYDWALLRSLGRCGVNVLSYVMDTLRWDGVIEFNLKKCKRYTSYKNSKSVYDGLNELLALDVLRRSEECDGTYYVNPNIMFRGDRSKIINVR